MPNKIYCVEVAYTMTAIVYLNAEDANQAEEDACLLVVNSAGEYTIDQGAYNVTGGIPTIAAIADTSQVTLDVNGAALLELREQE